MHLFSRLGASIALAIVSTVGHADSPPALRDSMLVTTDWLIEHLNDPHLVLLHVGDKNEYRAAHIPGARHVSLDDISVSDHSGKGLMLQFPAREALHDRLTALGISDESRIIVYFGKDWVSPATRVLFTLDEAGLADRSAMLDGGMPAWRKAGQTVTAESSRAAKPGTLAALRMQSRIVDADFVQAHLNTSGYAVIDARAASLYDGVETGGDTAHPHKTGHVNGARSLPYSSVMTSELTLKSPDELRAMFAAIGVQPGDTVVGYCHIGQQATEMLFAARSLGHPIRLYDGSFEDWSQRNLPVLNPSKAGTP